MPTYGVSKQRDMVRSVLPSTARKGARASLNAIRRAERSRARSRMAVYRGIVHDIDEVEHDPALDRYPDEDIKSAMWTRRMYDNASPLLRWGPRQVAHLRIEDRLAALGRMLPDTTAGRHAIDHLREHDELRVPGTEDWYTAYVAERERERVEQEARRVAMRARLRERVRRALEAGAHATLNRWLKNAARDRSADEQFEVRLLAGLHDIDAFVDHWCPQTRPRRDLTGVLLTVLDEIGV